MNVLLNVWGDSIAKGIVYDEDTQRYRICRENCCARLAAAGIGIENHSVMGQTSADGLRRMRAEELKAGELTVIEYGGNDCDLDWTAVSEFPERRQSGRVPAQTFERNLIELAARSRNADAVPVLAVPPPILAERYFAFVSRGRSAENILKYLGDVEEIARWQASFAERVVSAAEAAGARLVDFRTPFLAAPEPDGLFCADGIHPNARGHALMYEIAVKKLRKWKTGD